MSTGKRLAKRSILGTRVAAPIGDGLFLTGIIQVNKINFLQKYYLSILLPLDGMAPITITCYTYDFKVISMKLLQI